MCWVAAIATLKLFSPFKDRIQGLVVESTYNGYWLVDGLQEDGYKMHLERQQSKRLPVTYYMATFTLPKQLRPLGKAHPETLYNLLLSAAAETLKTFAKNEPKLSGELGFCSVLHTHSRRLDFHPHVHVVIPGGTVNKKRREWCKANQTYLFNGDALAKVFRAIFLRMLNDTGLTVPTQPKKWVVKCKKVGRGIEAIRYLSRYLYRGVISNKNILYDDGENVTFQYRESGTHALKTRTLRGEAFLKLLLAHVLPKGFRRARDYGFLHSNARKIIAVLQWVFRLPVEPKATKKTKASVRCKKCQTPMECVLINFKPRAPG